MARRLAPAFCGWAALLSAQPASAQERDFCAERPGQTTPPCTLDPGRAMIETALASWSLQADSASRTDTLSLGSTLLRAGVTPRLEAQFGWTPLGIVWTRDKRGGVRTLQSSTGDVTLGLIYGLAGANGPVALQGFLTLPTGGSGIGAGDWSAGVRVPASFDVGRGVQLGLTPEVDASANGIGHGRHIAYGGAAGIGFPLTPKVNLAVDLAVFRDDDPDRAETTASAGTSLAWQANAVTQFDIGGIVGLNRDTPDIMVSLGIAHRF